MELDAAKETAYVVRTSQPRGSAPTDLKRWAILDEDEAVVGYMSGRFRGGIPGLDLTEGAVAGFISMVLVSDRERGAAHAWHAVQEFAKLAQVAADTSMVGLRLDETGDLDTRRGRSERMGFEFVELIGSETVDALLAETEVNRSQD
jgi:hypothetical protein